jgi:hypothetical protein
MEINLRNNKETLKRNWKKKFIVEKLRFRFNRIVIYIQIISIIK